VLYKDGPPFFHGSYSVVVNFVDADGKPVEGFGQQRHFTWTSLAGLKRITEHVGKVGLQPLLFLYKIIVCYKIINSFPTK
jgi:tRNA-splicing endonuclease subunit Sen2